MSACVSCGESIPKSRKCSDPRCLRPDDPRCSECHAEKWHGAIPDVTGDGILGGNAGALRLKEPSPWRENNVRLMEEGGS